MRMEAKVYMSHTDLARIQKAAQKSGMSVSTLMRVAALAVADSLYIPRFTSLEDRQLELPVVEKVGGE